MARELLITFYNCILDIKSVRSHIRKRLWYIISATLRSLSIKENTNDIAPGHGTAPTESENAVRFLNANSKFIISFLLLLLAFDCTLLSWALSLEQELCTVLTVYVENCFVVRW